MNDKFQENFSRNWTDDLPICQQTGCGYSINQIYLRDGRIKESHFDFEKKLYCRYNEENFLYALCSGHNGASVADFALSRISADILLGGGIAAGKSDEDIKELLKTTFISAERGYNTNIDNLLATKQQLQFQILDLSQYEISQKYQDVLDRLNTINRELSIGSSVLTALITNKKLYIANLGVCRALLVKNDAQNDRVMRVIQVTVDHNLANEDELLRLRLEAGLDAGSLRNEISTTRCIGNFSGKGGFKDSEFYSQCFAEPISSTPEIIGPIAIDQSARFLLLLSGGLCKVLTQLFSEDLNIVNKELVSIVVQQFNKQSTLVGVSQSVINQISQLHHDYFMKTKMSGADSPFTSRDDMTLLIRNFSFDMPHSIEAQSIENSRQTTLSSTMFSQTHNAADTITSYSSTNTSINYSNSYPTERKTKAYVCFKEYFENVEQARKDGKLPKDVEFDDAPLV